MKKIFAFLTALICCLSMWSFVPAAQSLTLDKEDGEYSIQVDLEGGSGKASVTTPTLITVKDGSVTAKIQWSSSNYDYISWTGKSISQLMKRDQIQNLKFLSLRWMKACL